MKIIKAVVDKLPKNRYHCRFCVGMVDMESGDEHAYCHLVEEEIDDAVCPLVLQDVITVEQIENAWKQGHNYENIAARQERT
jgi:hypothetical protein